MTNHKDIEKQQQQQQQQNNTARQLPKEKKTWLTLDGPTPTNISRNSEPDTVMNGTLASPAVAFASNVLPAIIKTIMILICPNASQH